MRARSRVNRDHSGLLSRYSVDLGQAVSRRRSERALRAAAMEQAIANRAKSEFLANMSHELRTPLNAIIGFSDLIDHLAERDSSQGKAAEYARLISGAGNHLLDIISDILDISKIESGTFSLDLNPEALSGLIDSAVALVSPRIAERKQELLVKVAPGLPEVMVDGRRLKQVLINLLGNAHKFTPEGGRIIVTAALAGDGAPIIAVQDTGIGMSEDQLDLALRPFGQVKAAYVRGHEGTGLGLPISRALVEQHGGRFFVTSVPQKGTTVAFTLPRPVPAQRSAVRECAA